MRVTTRFETVRVQYVKQGQCPACGTWRRRQKTFEQTINPFNRNADGTMKTRDQIREELHAEGRGWEPDYSCSENHGARVR